MSARDDRERERADLERTQRQRRRIILLSAAALLEGANLASEIVADLRLMSEEYKDAFVLGMESVR